MASYLIYNSRYYYYKIEKKDWISNVINRDLLSLNDVLENWKEKNPGKEVLEDFKKEVNNFSCLHFLYSKNLDYHYTHILRLINLFIYFGLNPIKLESFYMTLNNKCIELEYEKHVIKKLIAGKKIANFIEDAMNDEFEMKPLRTAIDKNLYEIFGSSKAEILENMKNYLKLKNKRKINIKMQTIICKLCGKEYHLSLSNNIKACSKICNYVIKDIEK